MKTQPIYNRHHWLAVKQTIGMNNVPSFLNNDCKSNYTRYRNRRYETQATYYIDVLGIIDKIGVFFKGITSFFTVSVQTEWHQSSKSAKVIKSI